MNPQNNATSSTPVDENALNDQRGVQVFFCLVEIGVVVVLLLCVDVLMC